jgi:flagellar hook-associated protein 1
MGLSSALSNSLTGLRTTQAQIELVSQNVANADSAGYTKRRLSIVQQITADRTSGVRIAGIDRTIDQVVQRQLRTETAGGNYTDVRSDFYARIDQIFGQPGGQGALDGTFNAFLQSVQALGNNPADYTARAQTLSSAENLANRINTASSDVQALRDGAESRLAAAVERMNGLLVGIDRINKQIVGSSLGGTGEGSAALADERDRLIDELSGLVDVEVIDQVNGGVNVLTRSGLQLIGGSVAQFTFDRRYNLSANNVYDTNPALRGVGTISLIGQSGLGSDMVAGRMFRSGQIAALIEMRDTVLVEAQNQLDDLAAGLADTISNREVPGTAVGAGVTAGFTVDTVGVQPGNLVSLEFTVLPGGAKQRVAITHVVNPASQPIAEATSNAAQTVLAVDMTLPGWQATVQTKLNTLFGAGLTVGGAGTVLQINGTATRQVNAMTGSISNIGFTGQGSALPLFYDPSLPPPAQNYTGSFETGLSQRVGYGERITVNPAIANNIAHLVKYDPATPNGDATRPNFIYDRLTKTTRIFSPTTGIGTNGNPFNGTVAEFARRVVEDQGANSTNAKSLNEGQQVVVKALEKKFSDQSGVNIDEELSELVQVQNAYAANARIMSTVRELFDTLLRI